jgi:hypothetical protein
MTDSIRRRRVAVRIVVTIRVELPWFDYKQRRFGIPPSLLPMALSSGVKRTESKSEHSYTSSGEVMKE